MNVGGLKRVNGGWVAMRSIKYDGVRMLHEIPYHVISPVLTGGEWAAMVEWCVDTFGTTGSIELPGVWSKRQRWYVNNAKFWFRDDADRDLFLLKWS